MCKVGKIFVGDILIEFVHRGLILLQCSYIADLHRGEFAYFQVHPVIDSGQCLINILSLLVGWRNYPIENGIENYYFVV